MQCIRCIKQLSFKHLHIKYAKTGVLDYLFEKYKKGKTSSSDFIHWIYTDYDKELKEAFKPFQLYSFIVDKILEENNYLKFVESVFCNPNFFLLF